MENVAINENNDTRNMTYVKIREIVERVERLEEEKSDIQEDIKEVYSEAKAFGLDPKILKKIIAYRKVGKEKLNEEMELISLYANAVGLDI